jgi:SAM-dependent methyltransferase
VTLSTVSWKMSRAGQRLRAAQQREGLRGLGAEAGRILSELSRVPLALAAEYLFDRRRGIRTRGFVRNDRVLARVSVGGDPCFYQPIGLSPLRHLVSTVPLEPAETTFVDLGAGRGRAVILAAELGFGHVFGVELDADLAAEGAENVRRWRAGRHGRSVAGQTVEIVQGDAADCPLPTGPLLIALFNSFGPTTLRLFLEHLCDQRTGISDPVFFAYINPVHEETFEAFARLVPHARAPGWSVFRLEPDLLSVGPAQRTTEQDPDRHGDRGPQECRRD